MDDDKGFDITPALVFDLNLALYLDLIAVLEKAGVVTYRQMAARVINVSMDALEDGESDLANALEGIARGLARHDDSTSIALLKAARSLRTDEQLGDIPMPPQDP